jgi:hypothetical protein
MTLLRETLDAPRLGALAAQIRRSDAWYRSSSAGGSRLG